MVHDISYNKTSVVGSFNDSLYKISEGPSLVEKSYRVASGPR